MPAAQNPAGNVSPLLKPFSNQPRKVNIMQNSRDPPGYLRAVTQVEVTDIWGHVVMRSVTIGRAHGVHLLEAQDMIEKARDRNPGRNIQAEFKISL